MTAARALGPSVSGARAVLDVLAQEGVEVVFGYPGGAILPVYDALHDASLTHILCRHEQGAALAADGYARATGRVGVCLATSGPGATNLVTGLANAMMDSVPVVAITGQVPTHALGTDAFQEVDVLGMTMPVVKHGFLVRRPDQLHYVLREAFRVARSGRPGPVVVDLPKDVQLAKVRPTLLPATEPPRVPDDVDVSAAIALLRSARRPVVYAGGGVGMAGATDLFRAFVDEAEIPTVTTLKGLGLLPPGHPMDLGMLGMHGLRAANEAVQESDLLVVLGARFDDRVTGKIDGFAPDARVLHVDIDAAELGKVRAADVGLQAHLGPALRALSGALDGPMDIAPWRETCGERRRRHAWDYNPPHDRVYAPRLLRRLSSALGPDGVVTCDVGQHQMWVAQHCRFHRPENHLSSGSLGTMGYGLPAAIGAQLGRPEATVVNVSGDGSFMMNIQELATLVRYRIPVKVVLLDNSCLGMVRQWQELFLERRFSETRLDDNPDFAQVARAFGVPAFRIHHRGQEESAVERLLAVDGPALLHVTLDPEANVWPFVPPGHDNSTMWTGEAR